MEKTKVIDEKTYKERLKAIARDKLSQRIDLFIDSNIAELGVVLDDDEIRQLIAEKASKV